MTYSQEQRILMLETVREMLDEHDRKKALLCEAEDEMKEGDFATDTLLAHVEAIKLSLGLILDYCVATLDNLNDVELPIDKIH